jgi:hypothetical protein
MRTFSTFIALSLITTASARTNGQDTAASAPEPVSAIPAVADPMAAFARLVGGEWKNTAASGTSMYDTWHWGPGKLSVRGMTHGFSANGSPWRELNVMYWHPNRKRVCLWGVGPYQRSVSEGTITFEGDAAEGDIDLFQVGVRRQLGVRWTFDGLDKYHEALLERRGPGGLQPLAEWDLVRSATLTPVQPIAAEFSPAHSERLKALQPFLGRAWDATIPSANGVEAHIQSTFEWVPLADGIYLRTQGQNAEGVATHLLDGYFYHHTGTNDVRCLVLSSWGSVYEGQVTVIEGGALQLDLKGYEGDAISAYAVHLDLAEDGTVHLRAWSVDGTVRTPILDVVHKDRAVKKD